MDSPSEKKTTFNWNQSTESFFADYFQRKHGYIENLIVPHTESNLFENMRKDLNTDLDFIYNFYILCNELLNGKENFEGALPRTFKSPIYLILGIIDLCLNLIILAISLITCRISSLFYSENHKQNNVLNQINNDDDDELGGPYSITATV